MVNYLYGMFNLATMFIAVFIAVYAYLFLTKTKEDRERRPWDFLFVSSILFFVFELLALLSYFNLIGLGGLDILMVSKVFEFLYSGFVLLAFISQHDLILRSHLILISKKAGVDGGKLAIEGKQKKK
jgi:hypothetical protein